MENKEVCESLHQRDTAGKILYDIHCPYCRAREHTKEE